MKNLRDVLREYTKRQVIPKQTSAPNAGTSATTCQLEKPLNYKGNILENKAALLRKELSTRSNNDSFWALHRDMSENEAASQNLFYQFYINNRYKKWNIQETWHYFEKYVQRISTIKEYKPRNTSNKATEKITYTNMAHQAFKGV